MSARRSVTAPATRKLVTGSVRRSEFAGFVIGGMLYPLERLRKIASENPTTEIVVCRKRPAEILADWRQADRGQDESGDVA
jgi:hypothetical protein